MTNSLPASHSQRVADFLSKQVSRRGRLVFIVDATGSREKAWDMASKLQVDMFREATKFGTLDIQVVYFGGGSFTPAQCQASPWTSNDRELTSFMARVTCQTGETQYQKALGLARREHQVQPINAIVIVGDMVEESPPALYDAVAALSGVPLFLFQEGADPVASEVFPEMARLSKGGAYSKFTPWSARELAELLRAVAAYAAGGSAALANLRTDAAVKLLGQMRKGK
jgi:hypothetical protein